MFALMLGPVLGATRIPAGPSPAGAGQAATVGLTDLLSGSRPLPMDLGPIPRPEFLGGMRRGRPSRSASRVEDDLRDSLRIRDLTGGLERNRRPSGGAEKKGSDWSEEGQSRDSLLTGALGALPILKKVPLTSTPRGMGLAVGKVHGMGIAVEVPRAGGRRNAPPGEPTVPVLSVNCRF